MAVGRRMSGGGLAAAVLAALLGTATSSMYVVQLKGDPAVRRLPENSKISAGASQRVAAASSASAAVQAEHADFAKAAAGIKFETHFTYKQVFNGLSVTLAGSEAQQAKSLAALKALPQVKAVTKVVFYKKLNPNHRKYAEGSTATSKRRSLLQAPIPPQNGVLYNGNATRAYDVNTKLGITGLGVKVGVIDTGIDYMHPDLGNGFGPGHRVIAGYDFVGDDGTSDPTTGALSLFPDNDPRDTCDGHGTHVSGIIGANGNVVGSAPDVSFGAYRVFSCDGSTGANTIIIAAAELAYQDGMDIINLSLGSGPTWPTSGPDAVINEVLANLVYAGLVVSVSAGNSGGITGLAAGGIGLFGVSSPSNPPGVISVASSEDTTVQVHDMIVSPGAVKIPYVRAEEQQNLFPTATPLTLVTSYKYDFDSTGAPTSLPAADACTSSSVDPAVMGKVALVRRGTCALATKFGNVVAQGAKGIVVYNSVSVGLDRIISPLFGTGAAFISAGDGLTILKLLSKGGAVTVSFPNEVAFRVPSESGGALSDFSSYGPAVDLSFKPDISAPGSLILSTYPLPLGGYYEDQGTSMSCPALVGCAALLLQARPGFSAANVRYQLQNTAVPLVDISDTGLTAKPSPVHNQGAGQVDIYAALTYGLKQRITPSAVSLGYGNGKTVSIRVDNYGSTPTTYTLSHETALAELYSNDIPSQTKVVADATASFSVPAFTVPAGKTVNFEFTIEAPASLRAQSLYGGWVVLTSEAGVSRVPYIGWKGDFAKLDVVQNIALASDADSVPDGSGLVGSFQNKQFDFKTTIPTFVLNLFLPAQHFTATLTYLDTPNFSLLVVDQPFPLSIALGDYPYQLSNQAFQFEFVSFGNGYKFALPIEAADFGCTLPNGAYQIEFTVVNTGGLVTTYGGPQTYFRVVNALPTTTPYCQFTPVTKPTKVPAATTPGSAGTPRTTTKPRPKSQPKPKPRTAPAKSKPRAAPKAHPKATPNKKQTTTKKKPHPRPAPQHKAKTKPHRKPTAKGNHKQG